MNQSLTAVETKHPATPNIDFPLVSPVCLSDDPGIAV